MDRGGLREPEKVSDGDLGRADLVGHFAAD